jgi:steroid delta-isomerase-like uncharacterized protein
VSLDDNKAIVRRFIGEIFVDGRRATVDELLADNFVPHTWPSTGHPRDDMKAAIDRAATALAEPRFTIEDMIAEGDRVAVRLTTAATQVGPFMGMEPSGKRYEIGEIHIFRLRDGKVAEHWHYFDQMGMMRQLGAMPAGAGAAAGAGSAAGTGAAEGIEADAER